MQQSIYRVSSSVITVPTKLFTKNRKLHEFATTNRNFEEYRLFQTCITVKTYMCNINFQQNWVGRSNKTVHSNIFAKDRKLHIFAIYN